MNSVSRRHEWFTLSLALLLLSGIGVGFYLYERNRIADMEFQSSVYKELARNKAYYRDILGTIFAFEELLEKDESLDAADLFHIESRVVSSERKLGNLLKSLDMRMSDLETLVRIQDKYKLAGEYAALGELSSESGYHSEAAGFYQESLQYGQSEEVFLAYARSMYMASPDVRDDREILKALDAILVRSPYNREALQLRGSLYLEQGRKVLALESYEVLAALVPESFQIQKNTARLALLTGQFDKALIYYEKALALEDEDASLHHELGKVWKSLGEPDKAEISWRKAMELSPSLAAPALDLAKVLVAGGRNEEAREFAELYIQARGNDYEGYLVLGDIQYQNGEFLLAELSWKRAQDVLILNTETDITLWVDLSLRIARLSRKRGKAGKALKYTLAALEYEERAELLDIAIWSTEELGDKDASSAYRRRRKRLNVNS